MEKALLDTIKRISAELSKPLPGSMAQQKMAPSVRASGIRTGLASPPPESAVMLLLFPDKGSLNLVLIKRKTYDGPHSGQVGLPGGKYEPADSSLLDTVMRETEEEIGVNPDHITVIGKLTSLYIPISNLMVFPYVGYTLFRPTFHPNLHEVDYTITAPLGKIFSPQNISLKVIEQDGYPVSAPFFDINGEMVWGATAMILSEFMEIWKRATILLSNQKKRE